MPLFELSLLVLNKVLKFINVCLSLNCKFLAIISSNIFLPQTLTSVFGVQKQMLTNVRSLSIFPQTSKILFFFF